MTGHDPLAGFLDDNDEPGFGHAQQIASEATTRGAAGIHAEMLDKPTLGAFRDSHLEATTRWQSPVQCEPLSDEDREWVHDRIDALAAERQARSDAHRERIRRTAGWLGREVAAHRVTLADAERRIECLLTAFDPATEVSVVMVPCGEAKQIAEQAFASTFRRRTRE